MAPGFQFYSLNSLTLFYAQVRMSQGLPFAVRIPNAVTRKTFQETDEKKDLHKAKNVKDLFRQLEE